MPAAQRALAIAIIVLVIRKCYRSIIVKGFRLRAALSAHSPACTGRGECAMRQSNSSLQSSPPMHAGACPKCSLPMWLVHIEPDDPDHDIRTYECPECMHSEVLVVDIGRDRY